MVVHGAGWTLLPLSAAQVESTRCPELELRPFKTPSRRILGLAWRPGSPRAKAYTDLAAILRSVLERRLGPLSSNTETP